MQKTYQNIEYMYIPVLSKGIIEWVNDGDNKQPGSNIPIRNEFYSEFYTFFHLFPPFRYRNILFKIWLGNRI